MTKKYIRTEDRIYEFEKVKTRKFLQIGNTSKEVELDEDESVFPYPILKQADTIEELLDRVVLNEIDIILLNKEHTQYRFESSDEWFDITETELKIGIYGAIWTDKGLIYEARMVDIGKWELLGITKEKQKI